MPSYTPIVLADAETTPVNHTFQIAALSGGKLKAVNRAMPTIETQEILVIDVKPAQSSSGSSKVRISLGLPNPVTDDTTGAISVGEINSAVLEINFSATSTEQRRKNLRALFAAAISHAAVVEAIVEVEPFFT